MNVKNLHRFQLLLLSFITYSGVVLAAPGPDQAKLDRKLWAIAGADTYGVSSLTKAVLPTDGKKVHVDIRLNVHHEKASEGLSKLGFKYTGKFKGIVSGYIEHEKLLDLAALDSVSTVYPIAAPDAQTQSFQGDGVRVLRVDKARKAFKFDGTGVKVGVMSNSFAYLSKAKPSIFDRNGDGIPEISGTDTQLSGDLPEVMELLHEALPYYEDGKDKSDDQYDDEGRALSEVVYDMAPGADLSYFAGIISSAGFAEGIFRLAGAGSKVIVDDLYKADQPIYQDGEVSQAIALAVDVHDVVYVTSAGNFGSMSVEGSFQDADPENEDPEDAEFPKGGNLHNWDLILREPFPDPYLNITLMPHSSVMLTLYWENPFSGTLGEGASTDYNLYVLDKPELKKEHIVLGSDNIQGTPDKPFGDPIESVQIANDDDDVTTCYVVLNLKKGPPANFKLILRHNPRLTVAIQGDVRSTDGVMQNGHELSNKVLTVAAVNYVEAETRGTALGDPRVIDPTYYTSHGGKAEILFTTGGKRLKEPEVRYKPDLASVDGVNSTFFVASGGDYGFDPDTDIPNFLGTSCSAPHLAGIIALMRQANPELSAAQIRRIARQAATDIHEIGFDYDTGWGLLYADEAIEAAINPPVYNPRYAD